MFFLDDLAMSPFKGFLFIAREVANAVNKESEDRRAQAMIQLTNLHRQIENGEISEEEFEELELELLEIIDSEE